MRERVQEIENLKKCVCEREREREREREKWKERLRKGMRDVEITKIKLGVIWIKSYQIRR